MGDKMKVIWLVNIPFPDVCGELGIKAPVIGGWMMSLANMLRQAAPELHLCIVATHPVKELLHIEKNGMEYYVVPQHGSRDVYDARLETYFRQIYDTVQPDAVHIHGSEYPHSLAFVKACGNRGTVVSIQGMISVYAGYFYAGITTGELISCTSVRDILKGETLFAAKRSMDRRGEYEKELLRSVKHVMGRTGWDRANSLGINPSLEYHKCNETLRADFYGPVWEYSRCRPHSIFLSQVSSPLKGAHKMFEAMPMILREYPDAEIYMAGEDFVNRPLHRHFSYGNYLKGIIDRNGLAGKVHFMGVLNGSQMAEQYLKANVFVCPSSIENSPNSLGEAQLLGTPSVSSYTGGTMEFIEDGVSGYLYRFEETAMLAEKVCRIFADSSLARTLSENGRKTALARHDREAIAHRMLSVYRDIASER